MPRYDVTFKDGSVEVIDEADAYQQEGPMTTFFATGPGRQVVDCWSTRLASFRTSEVLSIRRVAPATEQRTAGEPGLAVALVRDPRPRDLDADDEVVTAARHDVRTVLVHSAS